MTWWQRLWRRRQMEEQLEKELRFHVEQHAADLDGARLRSGGGAAAGPAGAGRPGAGEGRAAAMRAGTRWVEDLGQDLRYAVRTLAAEAGICGGGAVDAGAGDRRDHGDVHGD